MTEKALITRVIAPEHFDRVHGHVFTHVEPNQLTWRVSEKVFGEQIHGLRFAYARWPEEKHRRHWTAWETQSAERTFQQRCDFHQRFLLPEDVRAQEDIKRIQAAKKGWRNKGAHRSISRSVARMSFPMTPRGVRPRCSRF